MKELKKQIQRDFVIGDEWLYLKIYTGYKTSDMILRDNILPLVTELLNEKLIDKWFFIRYNDPKYHLRIRFHLPLCELTGNVILRFNAAIRKHVNDELIWKIQADTYQREIERYGSSTMELSEDLFFVDSTSTIEYLALATNIEDENTRWLMSMQMIDTLLEDFGYKLDEKKEILEQLQQGYSSEFNVETDGRQQLSLKYRKYKTLIEQSMKYEILTEYGSILNQKSEQTRIIANQLREAEEENEISCKTLMHSHIHMLMNRLFRTNQRKNELVVYDFLFNYYKSQIARQKYQTINQDNKAKNYQISIRLINKIL